MEMASMVTEIQLVDEFSSIVMWASNFSQSSAPSTLYLHKICKAKDLNLPQPFNKFLISSLFIPQNAHQQASSRFLNCIYTDELVCQAYDEAADSVFIIFYCKVPHITSFILLKLSPEELFPDSLEYYKQITGNLQGRIKEIKAKSGYKLMCENYLNCLNDLIGTSVAQFEVIKGLQADLAEAKEKQLKTDREQANERKDPQGNMDCTLCKEKKRNTMFLPCGHVVACIECVQEKLNIEVNQEGRCKRYRNKCTVCKRRIKEAKEVFY